MHRATPINSSFRAYSAGGARSVVEKVDDTKQMQEATARFMKDEKREKIEAPQNYGFTSYTTDADKSQQQSGGQQGGQGGQQGGGQEQVDGPETFVMFVGGNRSLPVIFPIDDRRNRLTTLKQGDVAMYRLQLDRQQFHMVVDPDRKYYGTFWSTRDDRINRVALVPQPSQQDQQQQPKGYGGSGQGSQQQKPKKGQADCLDDNNKSPTFWEQTKDHYFIRRGNGWIIVTTDYVHIYNGSDGGGEDQLNTEPSSSAKGSHTYVYPDRVENYNGNGHVLINDDTVETYWKDDTISTKVDDSHAHIRCGKMFFWVTKGGCHCTVRPTVSQDPDA